MYSLPPTRYSSTVCSVCLVIVTSGSSPADSSGPAENAGGGGSGSGLSGAGFSAKAAALKPPSSKMDRKRIVVVAMNLDRGIWDGRILADVRRDCADRGTHA